MKHFCTYFDSAYIPKALVMLDSLKQHCPSAIVHVLCLDEKCLGIMQMEARDDVVLYTLSLLEKAMPELLSCKTARTNIEYFWTLTPCFPTYILGQIPSLTHITYLDADLFFLSNPLVLFEEMPNASVLITPHRFSEIHKDKVKYGIYNVSWLTFSNTVEGRASLAWYKEQCIEWCFFKIEDTRMGDQKYLDVFEQKFENVHPVQHHGAGVAVWNIQDADFHFDGNTPTVNGFPIIFYHAHGFWQVRGPIYDTGLAPYCNTTSPILLDHVFRPYASRMHHYVQLYGGDSQGCIRRQLGKAQKHVSFNELVDKLQKCEYVLTQGHKWERFL